VPEAPAAKPRKLSYKDQRELDALPDRIEQLEAEKSSLETSMQDPAFYSRPHDETRGLLARLEQLTRDIDSAYSRWEALSSQGPSA
jgi:ATP-binding cassette subfamily F protein uup